MRTQFDRRNKQHCSRAVKSLRILWSLIEQIVVRRGERGPEIKLVGAIAAMVELAMGAQTTKAARGGAALGALKHSSVNLVAGAGFEPAAFRL